MFQMTAAPTMEMAMGMKINALLKRSYLLRSANTAINSPNTTVTIAPNGIQNRMLLRNAVNMLRLVKTST